jgi:hypothetical protein
MKRNEVLLGAGITKDVMISGSGITQSLQNYTGEIIVEGNMISISVNGKSKIFIGCSVYIDEK